MLELLEDPLESQVNRVAEAVGIRPVGWIFTDLLAEDLSKGTVKHFRGNIVSYTILFYGVIERLRFFEIWIILIKENMLLFLKIK